MKNELTRRLPAEWECNPAVLLAWPHSDTDWAPLLDDARKCVADIAAAVTSLGRRVIMLTPDPAETKCSLRQSDNNGLVSIVEYTTNDTWARDFGPITVASGNDCFIPIDFQFNGWGLKFAADRDNLVNLALKSADVLNSPLENRRSFILEGGSIDSDGRGTIITTSECLLSPNRNGSSTRDEIELFLKSVLGTHNVIWLDHGALLGDDTDSHVDTLARFAPGHKLLYNTCVNPADANKEAIDAMEREILELAPQHGITPVPLPLPDPVFDPDDGHQLPATYANFLALPEAILMPHYGQPEADNRAADIIEETFGVPVIGIDCRVLIRQHGSLHCMTMQIPAGALNPVD
ncbi:MAG: agmatine deiminase family protein [Bacteroides sp.]|nr:agmatine deiminase family protein [Bacteroides sp.]